MKTVFTAAARSQLLAALAYIRDDNPSAAVAFRDKAEESLSRLRRFPEGVNESGSSPLSESREVVSISRITDSN